jgi:thiosulfate/3-mercaptopyruvate sulfurtransferase
METGGNCSDDGRMTTWPESSPLLTANALRQRLGTPELIIVDCRHDLARPAAGRQDYLAGHIPGAVFASVDDDLAAPKRADTGRHPLPSPRDFAAVLGRWGFTPRSRVVAYDQGPGAWAARLWWMLRACGHSRVQVLDGGLAAWRGAAGKLDGAIPQIVPTEVAPREFSGTISTDEVARGVAASNITLVDARAADRFAGRNETVDPVAGRIPGSINVPFLGNLGPDQCFLPPADLRARWAGVIDRAGNTPLVAMCGSGVTACHNLLALELAGYAGTRLYVGSFSEWITNPARPVATGD